MPPAIKIPAAKAAVDKEWENWRNFRCGTWQKSEVKKMWSMKQERIGRRSSFCIIDGRMPFEKCWVGGNSTKSTKVELYSAMILQKTILGLTQYSPNKDHQHLKWQQPKSWLSSPDCQVAHGQAADAVSAYTQVKIEDAHKLLKISKSECPDIWIRLPRHEWPKSWSSIEDPVLPLERNLYGHPSGRTIMGKAIWENRIKARLGEKFPTWNACSYTVKKGYSYLCMWMA